METVAYLLLALAVIGALAYALYQVNARQKRLMAELTRLERLTAEVTMSAEALLDEVDQRAQRLSQLAAELEQKAVRQVQAPPSEAHISAAGSPAAEPAALGTVSAGPSHVEPAATEFPAAEPRPEWVSRPGGEAKSAEPLPGRPDSGAAAPVQFPAPSDRYRDLRQVVWRLADEGRDAVEIAEALGVPRGEVMLLLNLRGKKAAH